ncbi:hypothetical protein CFOL_v3_10096 [Cephalotus follicularis]|uniref:Protein CHUP1, chloroplastic n=1 Tax=Cephalotus follicularis TaxID=3775 RepID=A0A1Q3BEY0_CEPFO|nr:hypothetical protein CFOL_v3_10096 [Cephalotus follicularis]
MKAEQEKKMPQEDDESEITCPKKEFDTSSARIDLLEKENQELRQEIARLKAQVSSLKACDNERKSMLWKKLQNSIGSNNTDASQQKPTDLVRASEKNIEVEIFSQRPNNYELTAMKERTAKVAKSPPRLNSAINSSLKRVNDNKDPSTPTLPPPPPPLPSKMLVSSRSVRRVPELVELYRSLTRKEVHMDSKTSPTAIPAVIYSKNMIGEIEDRSTYLSAIKSDVAKQRQFINFLIKEVESAAYTEISDVEPFVKWLDEELSSLTDERAVLKHFPQWPERKADTLREAAFSYRDLRNLETEVSSFKDNPKEPLTQALRRMQALQDRLEQSVSNIERTRESTSKRYRDFQVPWEWMLNTGMLGQMKLSSLKLAKEYMKRITKELHLNKCSKEENLLLQGVRFAYRIHQFAGGFNVETARAFEELKKVGLAVNNQ